jgi:transcriptional regulator with XRE-family HTH domain
MENQTINKRIALIIEDKKLTPNSFAIKLGVKPTIVYNILKDRNKPGFDLLNKICEAFVINANWLLNGSGNMYEKLSSFDELNYIKSGNLNSNDFINNSSDTLMNIKIYSEAEFLNIAQERSKKISYLYQRLIDIRILLFQELNIRVMQATQSEDENNFLVTQAEADLLQNLTKPTFKIINDQNILILPFENLNREGKVDYLQKTEECITLFTNTFFDYFIQLYKGIKIPLSPELRKNHLEKRANITDNWHYTHYI